MRTMMLLPILAAAAGMSAPAPAQDSDTGEVAVSGNVVPLCLLGAPSSATVDLGNMVAVSGTRTGRIRAIGAQVVTLPASFCNYAGSMLTVDATALVETTGGTAAAPANFARAVNFTATAGQWGGGSAAATSAANASGSGSTARGTSAVQPTPRQTDIAVTLSDFSVPGDALLVAGDYAGIVKVTLGPSTTGN
ncbi:hypothetical protein [Tsuneonella amylolytica]|uniref:hypothetical protein n=1 Tax=Tsuneonella amylolytica TaxID=2338327 RepID=UPI000EA9387E|nr:hypothetical protein [Tsuneonella amylolytica]